MFQQSSILAFQHVCIPINPAFHHSLIIPAVFTGIPASLQLVTTRIPTLNNCPTNMTYLLSIDEFVSKACLWTLHCNNAVNASSRECFCIPASLALSSTRCITYSVLPLPLTSSNTDHYIWLPLQEFNIHLVYIPGHFN